MRPSLLSFYFSPIQPVFLSELSFHVRRSFAEPPLLLSRLDFQSYLVFSFSHYTDSLSSLCDLLAHHVNDLSVFGGGYRIRTDDPLRARQVL